MQQQMAQLMSAIGAMPNLDASRTRPVAPSALSRGGPALGRSDINWEDDVDLDSKEQEGELDDDFVAFGALAPAGASSPTHFPPSSFPQRFPHRPSPTTPHNCGRCARVLFTASCILVNVPA